MFNYFHEPGTLDVEDKEETNWYGKIMSKFDLSLTAVEYDDENLLFNISYCTRLFKAETIDRIIGYFKKIITLIIGDTGKQLAEIGIISEEEKRRIIFDFNNTEREYPGDKTIHQLFEEQVKKTPDGIALAGADPRVCPALSVSAVQPVPPVRLSYRQLNLRANRLARRLRIKGIAADTTAAILIEPCIDMIVGILAVLKSGACYLPIDPTNPEGRIQYLLTDSEAGLLLTNAPMMGKAIGGVEILNIADETLYSEEAREENIAAAPGGLVYMIYTSGTSGEPKGVQVKHENLVNYVHWFSAETGPAVDDKTVLTSSFAFDLGYSTIYPSLSSGAQLHLVSKEIYMDPGKILNYIHSQGITYLKMTPSLFSMIVMHHDFTAGTCSRLRLLVLGGEAINTPDVEKAYRICTNLRVMNHYGPTETTIGCIAQFIERRNLAAYIMRPTIGRPIFNTKVYILDKYFNLLPVGIAGELCIGGAGLAKGYFKRDRLTGEKFIKIEKIGNGRVYRTGDLGRWHPDPAAAAAPGDCIIEFLGRIDHQVKIRGFRVEPGEIENHLLKHPGIKEAILEARELEKTTGKYLCAYIVSDREYEAGGIREFLSKELPDYMIPSYFVRLEKMPLTPNGKIDRGALPKPGLTGGGRYTAPGNEIETKLVEIWSEVLGGNELHAAQTQTAIGIDDDFFRLGGHSLRATILAAKIHKKFDVIFPLAEIFKRPTIREGADYIDAANKEKYIRIEPLEKKEYYPLSSAQKRLYFLQMMEKSGTAYNLPRVMKLEGKIDAERLDDTFAKLIQGHESLRTSFHMVEEESVQRIYDKVEFEIVHEIHEKHEKNNESPITNKGEPATALISSFIRSFDLSRAPLLRVGLIEIEKNSYLFLVDMHHITADGLSSLVLVQDFAALYSGKELPEIKLQYRDYAGWQNREKVSKKIQEQGEYWKKEYEGEIPVLELPIDHARPAARGFEGDRVTFEINNQISGALQALALEAGATPYILLLAIYNILLAKLTGQEDIVIGSPVAGRKHADLENIIGMFVNTLALRNYPSGEKTFALFLGEVKERTLLAIENQEYQYEDLVEKVAVTRDAARNPLFDTMFGLQNTPSQEIGLPGLKLAPYEYESKTSKFDLTLTAVEIEGKLQFTFEYSTELFKQETIERFIAYFINIIRGAVENKQKRISDFEIITEAEKKRILFDFNNSEREYPKDKTIRRLFEDQVEGAPDRIAVIGVEAAILRTKSLLQITYHQLNKQADGLAGLLIEKGVLADTIVGIMMERSIDLVIGIFGILKSGGAYLPIDPGYPPERIDYMLKDSEVKFLVTANDKEGEKVRRWEGEKIFIESVIHFSNNLKGRPHPGLHHSSFIVHHSSPLVYIIYTSGSTGKPKGVMVEQEGFLNLLHWYNTEFQVKEDDNVLLITPISFDLSQKHLFSLHMVGGRLTIPAPGIPDYHEMSEVIRDLQITIINCAPSVFNPLIEFNRDTGFTRLKSLRIVILGGEAMQGDKLLPWVNSASYRCEIMSTYGPTEGTDITSLYRIPGEDFHRQKVIPIGKPIFNVKVYILDKYLRVLPVRIPGELCIGGISLARGYHNNIELTRERFSAAPHLPEKRVYRTGDIARWLADGNIEFIRRIDQQVKIRGIRIELGEIENKLSRHEKIKEVVVVSGQYRTGDNYLCAYIVPNNEFIISELREYLARELPDYMIPAYFMTLEKIPLTPNGKIDRKVLPKPRLQSGENYVAPGNDIETKLAGIWSEVLGRDALPTSQSPESIGVDDNFFQLGGHSLKATVLVSKIHREFDVRLPLVEIFRTPTIRGLSIYIKHAAQWEYKQVESAEKKEYYVLSSAQKRLHFLQQLDKDGTAYNISSASILEGVLDRNRLEDTFVRLVKRHESFRTSFVIIGDDPVQRVHDDVEFEIEYYNPAADERRSRQTQAFLAAGDKRTGVEAAIKAFIRPFDLSQAPLLRVRLERLEQGRDLMMVSMHHIISDGTSMGILVKEFMALYEGKELPLLKVHYKDYARWQTSEKNRRSLITKEKFWTGQLVEEFPVLNLPTDYPRPLVQGFAGNHVLFELTVEETLSLKTLALERGVTLYMLLLAICNTWFSKMSGEEDIIIGTPVAGRKHIEYQDVVGMFVNTLALRNYPAAHRAFDDFLMEIKQRTLEAFQNQDYPFEELVDRMVKNRDTSRNPLFDVMFAFQNMDIPGIEIPGLVLKPYEFENNTSKFDLNLDGIEKDGRLFFSLEYSTRLFKDETARRFCEYFKNILNSITGNSSVRIADIEIMGKEEKKKILEISNGIGEYVDPDITVHGMFENAAVRNKDKTALVFGESRITYGELSRGAGFLARVLRSRGVGREHTVGLMVERSFDTVIGMLAIMKAGGAYLPIDPKLPGQRKRFMAEDSRMTTLLTNFETGRDADYIPANIPVLDMRGTSIYCDIPGDGEELSNINNGSDLVYVIFTSGSTGMPKGVMIEQRNLINLIRYQYNYTGIDFSHVLQFTTIGFDVSAQEIFSTLLAGGQLTLVSKETLTDIPGLFKVVEKGGIKTLFLPTSFLKFVINEEDFLRLLPAGVRHIVTAGEQMMANERFIRYLKEHDVYFHNHYGPSETHVVTAFTVKPGGEMAELPPIGRPVANTWIYLLDKGYQPVPIGITGELFI
jgi:amino acid adenylation domain-containing protein